MSSQNTPRSGYKRPPLTNRVRQDYQQEEWADQIASLLVGLTIEDVQIEHYGSGDNRLLIRGTRKVFSDQGDEDVHTRKVTLEFNELGIWPREDL